jgi:hypothetical protein
MERFRQPRIGGMRPGTVDDQPRAMNAPADPA